MRRLWLGIALLAALLALGIWVAAAMQDIHEQGAAMLDEAAAAAQRGEMPTAQRLSEQAACVWEAHRRPVACVADHTPMDEIDALFAQLPVYARSDESVHFAATCAQLAQLLRAMGDAHTPAWWSIL